MDLPSKGYKRNLVVSAYIILAILGITLFFKYLLSPLLPFIIAYITALFLRPSIDKITKRTHLPKKFVAFFSVGFVFALTFLVIGIFFGRMLSELKEISNGLVNGTADMVEDLFGKAGSITDKIPILNRLENEEAEKKIAHALSSMIESALTSLSAKLPDAVMSFASSLPGVILFLITLIVSTFYMGADIGSLNAVIVRLIPESSRQRVFDAKAKLMKAGAKYIRAYAVILFITFIQLLIGFLCLKIPYALTLSVLIAFIDILPVLGVGTVLVPWAIILLIGGDSFTGVGLLIVFAIIWLIRQVSEPKIVGESVGISPLTTLLAMYVGFKLTGFGGLFLFPIVAIIIKALYEAGIFDAIFVKEKEN